MAACSQVYQNKRGRDDYLNGGFALPDEKRTNSGRLADDCYLMALLEKIDNMDAIDSNPEEIHITVNQLKPDEKLNAVMKSMEDGHGILKGQENGKSSSETGFSKQSERITEGQSETSSVSDTVDKNLEGNLSPCYNDVCAELDFYVDDISPNELGIIMQNQIDGDLMPDILYSDTVHDYVERSEVFYGFDLWEDDIWQLNEHPVIQNDFSSPQQEEFGINGAEFREIWN